STTAEIPCAEPELSALHVPEHTHLAWRSIPQRLEHPRHAKRVVSRRYDRHSRVDVEAIKRRQHPNELVRGCEADLKPFRATHIDETIERWIELTVADEAADRFDEIRVVYRSGRAANAQAPRCINRETDHQGSPCRRNARRNYRIGEGRSHPKHN